MEETARPNVQTVPIGSDINHAQFQWKQTKGPCKILLLFISLSCGYCVVQTAVVRVVGPSHRGDSRYHSVMLLFVFLVLAIRNPHQCIGCNNKQKRGAVVVQRPA